MNTIKTVGFYSFLTGKTYANKGLKASAEKRHLAKLEKEKAAKLLAEEQAKAEKARILAEKVRAYREASDKRIAQRAQNIALALLQAQENTQKINSYRIYKENTLIRKEKLEKVKQEQKTHA